MNPASIDEQRKSAHEFTRELIKLILPVVTGESLKSAFSLIDKECEEMRDRAKKEMDGKSEDDQRSIVTKAHEDFSKFQGNMINLATHNIRSLLWGIAGPLTGDYYPDLLSEDKKRKEASSGDQAKNEETLIPRITVLQDDPKVDSGETMPSAS